MIVGLNKVSRKGSSRKVYFRFLLIKGRDFYCNLFSSQQTWVLLIVQLGAILFQGVLALATSYNELSSGPGVNDFEARFNAAFFGAVQTRHAGFAVYDMQVLKSSTLIAYLLFMFLAPAPLAAVQNSKAEMQALESQLEAMVEEEEEDSLRASQHIRPSSLYARSGRLLNIVLATMKSPENSTSSHSILEWDATDIGRWWKKAVGALAASILARRCPCTTTGSVHCSCAGQTRCLE